MKIPSPRREVRRSFFQQIGAGFNADASFADQDGGQAQTATFDSIRDYLVQNGLSKEVFSVSATD